MIELRCPNCDTAIHRTAAAFAPITRRQRHVLDVLATCVVQLGYAPTYAALAAAADIGTKSTAYHHVQGLILRGYVRRLNNGRGIDLTPEAWALYPGRAQAGGANA